MNLIKLISKGARENASNMAFIDINDNKNDLTKMYNRAGSWRLPFHGGKVQQFIQLSLLHR